VYGLVGPAPARLNLLWRKFASAPLWLRGLLRSAPTATTWRQGQNLAMAGAVLLLLGLTLPLAASGIAAFHEWGETLGLTEVWEEVHEALGEGLLMVVLAHLGLIAVLSLLRRKNVAAPMLTGRVEGVGPDLVRHNRTGLALLLLAAVLAWGAWEWQQSPQGLVTPAGLASIGSGHADDDDDDD
jgi:cytochrome b